MEKEERVIERCSCEFKAADDAHLDKQIYDLLREIEEEADLRRCFIEVNMRENGADRSW